MILAAAVVMLLSAYGLIGWRLTAPMTPGSRCRAAVWSVWTLTLLCILWFPAGWFLTLDLDRFGLEPLRHWAIFLSMGAFVLVAVVVLGRDLLWSVAEIVRRVNNSRRGVGAAPHRRMALRQIINLGTLFFAATVGAGTFVGARRRAATVRVEVPIPNLPSALDGFRIVQISDLHVGHTVTRSYVRAVVEGVNDLGADLIAVTGDLTDGTVVSLRAHVEPLRDLRAREGAFFVTGNHDYYFGDGEAWVEETRRLGLTPLMNEHRLIERGGGRLLLAGVPDFRASDFVEGHHSDPRASLSGAPAADLKVLLAHQPRSTWEAEAAGFDLQLSGHTHGGQIFPMHFVARLKQPAISGLHRIGSLWVYVSRGTGYWGPPFRLLAPSEITLIILRRG
jgi:hypothetical protein